MVKYNDLTNVFLNSLDNLDDIKVKKIKVKNEINVMVNINTRKFSDGSPVLKYFFRNPQYINYIFKPGCEMELIIYDNEEIYWYDNNNWYQLICDDANEFIHTLIE